MAGHDRPQAVGLSDSDDTTLKQILDALESTSLTLETCLIMGRGRVPLELLRTFPERF